MQNEIPESDPGRTGGGGTGAGGDSTAGRRNLLIARLTTFRLVLLAALALCGASLADWLLLGPAYCGFQSGCGDVAASIFARPLGVPLPIAGVAGFAIILVLSLVPRRAAYLACRGLAAAVGIVGLTLMAIQLLILERVCPLCMLVDASGIALAVMAMSWRSMPERTRLDWLRLPAWMAAGCAVAALPIAWSWLSADSPPPPQVSTHWMPGKINVVEITDFDCPHCARFEPILIEALRGDGNCQFVRVPCPMPMHKNARPAARAFLAASRQGQGEEMASALFAAESRTATECRRLARGLGLDLAAYDRTIADPAIDSQLDETVAWAKRTGPGLPMIWVQNRFFPKAPSLEQLRQALDRSSPLAPGTN